MYQNIHRKMTLFCGTITSLILLAMTLAGLAAFENLLDKNDTMVHDKTINTVLNALDGVSVIDYNGLSQIADSRAYTITLYGNSVPHFLYQDKEKQELTGRACRLAAENYDFQVAYPPVSRDSILHLEFPLTDKGTKYLASFSSIPHKYGTYCAVILYSRARIERQIFLLRLFILGIDLAALVLLFWSAWIYTGRMLRPIEENRKKQIQFVSSASHELRSPLAVLLSSADALAVADEPDRENFHRIIRSEGHRMSQLINDMLSLASSDSGTWSMHLEYTQLDAMIPGLYEKYLPLAESRDLRLRLDLSDPDEYPDVCCDITRIEQVIGILLDNAISYTPAGGTITLGLAREGSGMMIRVSDTGPGVPDEWKDRIFDRFFRADSSRKEKKHFGLGLSIAREIVRLHGGRLWVEDRAEGGAVFCLLLFT